MFIEVYQAFPAKLIIKDEIEFSNSIILPNSALSILSSTNCFNSKDRIFFRILNIELNIHTHCTVADFTAEEGKCYLPEHIFDQLALEKGQKVNIRMVKLELGYYIKLQPHKNEFNELPNRGIVAEFNLTHYFCVTEGDTISVKFGKKIYKIDVIECKPDKAIRTLNCDIEVDFAPPKDYKEPEKPVNKGGNSISVSNIKYNSEEKPIKLSKEEIQKQITDKKFSGHHFRMDGKDISNNQAMKIIKSKLEHQSAEDNYDPRKCRIPSNPRPAFKYVEL